MVDIKLSKQPLNESECIRMATNPHCGGMAVFVGTVRNKTAGKTVLRLEFESYEPMAIKELQQIAATAAQKWTIKSLVIHHRLGVLQVKDMAVIVVIHTAHRKEAFEACSFVIDALKKTVPIWKKEVFEDGAEWVNAYP